MPLITVSFRLLLVRNPFHLPAWPDSMKCVTCVNLDPSPTKANDTPKLHVCTHLLVLQNKKVTKHDLWSCGLRHVQRMCSTLASWPWHAMPYCTGSKSFGFINPKISNLFLLPCTTSYMYVLRCMHYVFGACNTPFTVSYGQILVWFGIIFIPQDTIELILRDYFEPVRYASCDFEIVFQKYRVIVLQEACRSLTAVRALDCMHIQMSWHVYIHVQMSYRCAWRWWYTTVIVSIRRHDGFSAAVATVLLD